MFGDFAMSNLDLDPLDVPVFGVQAFARVLNRPARKIYADLEAKRFDGFAKKWGRVWVSTPRRLLASLEPEPVDTDRNSAG